MTARHYSSFVYTDHEKVPGYIQETGVAVSAILNNSLLLIHALLFFAYTSYAGNMVGHIDHDYVFTDT